MGKEGGGPEHVPSLYACDGGSELLLSDFEAQHLADVGDRISDYFLCRRKECLFVCRNTDWIPRISGGAHYLCPACGERYRPWKASPDWTEANKVYVVKLDGAADAQAPGEVGIFQGSDDNRYRVYGYQWADTATTSLTNLFKEVHADAQAWLTQLPPKDRLGGVIEWVNAKGAHALFKHQGLSELVRWKVDDFNEKMGDKSKAWTYINHQVNGFWGAHFTHLATESAITQKEMIRLWGLTRWLHRAATKTLGDLGELNEV